MSKIVQCSAVNAEKQQIGCKKLYPDKECYNCIYVEVLVHLFSIKLSDVKQEQEDTREPDSFYPLCFY